VKKKRMGKGKGGDCKLQGKEKKKCITYKEGGGEIGRRRHNVSVGSSQPEDR